ncbi:MAG: flagellar filament capping protein FliD [Pirellulales bacterium]|nr:flagellar filament capping protein FliD [Pirellulales bacterium]
MGRIGSNIGLITGFPIADTVDKLIAIAAKPRDTLKSRVDDLTVEQNSFTVLSAGLLKLQLTALKLSNTNIFDQRTSSSSDDSLIRVSTTGSPAVGTYQFTPLQLAQSQQLLSSGFASNTAPIGAGKLNLRFGGAIDEGISLGTLNGGLGVATGSIRITDRSGASAVVDLRAARTVDDVIHAVNTNTAINVRLETRGDKFVLVDKSGQMQSNLRVQEVGGGSTAADLGLLAIDAAANTADGQDVVRLGRDVLLSSLNNGNGLRFDASGADLRVNFRDGSAPLDVDFSTPAVEGSKATATTNAAAGLNGQLVFSALKAGPEFGGVQIRFKHEPSMIKGNESATYDANTKELVFKISEGVTTASDIIQALGRSPDVAAKFTVRLAAGSTGNGLVTSTDSGIMAGPPGSVTTPGVQGPNSRIKIQALREGKNYDGVTVRFANDQAARGTESITYDDVNKKLTFHVAIGQSTASDAVAAIANSPVVAELFKIELADGSDGTGLVDPGDEVQLTTGELIDAVPAKTARTVGEMLDTLNAADPARLKANISASGDSIELVDLTAGAAAFSAADLGAGHVATDLGFAAADGNGVIAGKQVLAGLKTALLSSLGGREGLGDLGLVQLTDRSGASATVDLSAAVTLDDVISAINAAGIGVSARVNDAHNGIQLTDTTGQTASNLVVANGDATNTADALGLAVNEAVSTAGSGSLNLQTVNENTLLSSLNGGAGITKGSFKIFGTASAQGSIDLAQGNINTVGDLIRAIDALQIGVDAQVNEAGDGIELIDTIGAGGTLRVEEGSSTAARELGLLNAATTREINGEDRQVIDASTTYSIDIAATDTLTDLAGKINNLGVGISAAEFNSGAGVNPYRLTINSQRSGAIGNLVFDTSQAGFSLQETARGQDALVRFGNPVGGTLSASSTNQFNNILPGVNLQLVAASTTAVDVSVSSSGQGGADAIQALVDSYNQVRAQIAEATKFTPATDDGKPATTGPLFGDSSVLQVDTELASLFSRRVFRAGSLQSLQSVGLSLEKDGSLKFDSAKYDDKLATDPQAVKDLFSTKQFGLADRIRSMTDRLSSGEHALLINRMDAINVNIRTANAKIEDWNKRLETQKNALLLKFYRMDLAIAKMQDSLKVIGQLQTISNGSFTSANGSAS